MSDDILPADDRDAQAVLWVVRTGDPQFTDWAGFEAWLGADPAHATAYHAAAAATAAMVERLAALPPAQLMPRGRRAMPWLAGALTGALVLAAGYQALKPAPPPLVYQTAAGTRRDVALADGTRIMLNGDTRLTAAAADPRAIRLERGEALFDVRHDPARPFSVAVAGATIADVGTVFDVARNAGETRVAVAQGSVVWNPGVDAVRLDAGQGLRAADGSGPLERARIDAGAVGGWARGQLSYDGAPLAIVAADLSRALGVVITVSSAAATRPVRGVVRLEGGAPAVLPRLGALLGVTVRRDARGWSLSTPP